jgi:hypothetical protein|tara:strand:- start:141531 stop:141851 length:321 start_codon:yes stop_codon:yes gene_type:complete
MWQEYKMNISNQPDDSDRGSTGVLATLRNLSGGKAQLIFDDVQSISTLDALHWSQDNLFTIKEFDLSRLEKMDFTKEELVEIAENILIRLSVLGKTGIKPKGYNAT